MLKILLECALLSFRAPRAGARAILELIDGYEGVGLLFGLSFTLTALLMLFGVSVAPQDVGEGGDFSFIVVNLVLNAVAFAMTTAVIYGLGRMFGGQGDLLRVATIVAWHSLVTVVFTPFISLEAMADPASGFAALQMVVVFFSFWLLVNFIAEAHGFRSAWKVAGAVVGMGVFLSLFISFLLGGGL